MKKQSIKNSIEKFKVIIQTEQSPNSYRTHNNALNLFVDFLENQGLDLDEMVLAQVSEKWLLMFETSIQEKALSTQKTFLTRIMSWYKYLSEQGPKLINLEYLRRQVQEKINYQPPPAPILNFEVARIIEYVTTQSDLDVKEANERLRLQRNRALILALADTGFSTEKLCELKRENVDIRRKLIQIKDAEGNNSEVQISL